MYIENRWFTKEGKAKRVPKEFAKFKPLALENKPELTSGNIESVCKYASRIYNLGLAERWQFIVAFYGLGGIVGQQKHWAFTQERYDAGMKLLATCETKEMQEKK